MPIPNGPAILTDMNKPNGKLLRTVILSRHGIRSPKESITTLEKWTRKHWPEWSGNPGDLSERGKELITAQWASLKPFYVRHGLMPEFGCPPVNDYSVVADEDQRTRQTAIAIFDGLLPRCHIRPKYGVQYDLLFHPDPANYRVMDRQKALAEVQAMIDHVAEDPAVDEAMDLLQDITECCRLSFCGELGGVDTCTLKNLPSHMQIDPRKPKLDISGKWFTASTLAEVMLLEYAQWPERDAGWGSVDKNVLQKLILIHNGVFNATHRAPLLAKAGGTHMLKYICETLLDENAPKLTVLAGHDTNIAYVSGLLGLHWAIPEQGKDSVIPGSFLSVELWKNIRNEKEIRIDFSSPTFDSLHTSSITKAIPIRVPVEQGIYRADDFLKKVEDITGSPS